MDNNLLKSKISSSGLKYIYIAKELNISYAGLRKKMNGDSEFNISEVNALIKILNLNHNDASLIFFENERDK